MILAKAAFQPLFIASTHGNKLDLALGAQRMTSLSAIHFHAMCISMLVAAHMCWNSHAAFQPPPDAASPTAAANDSTIAHLPDGIQHDILAWRRRLTDAKCLKVVCETEQTWGNMDDLDETGTPRIAFREQYVVHGWMTPDSLWAVIFGRKGGVVDESTPLFQEYWDASTSTAWERVLVPETSLYKVRRYECKDFAGPESPDFSSGGCIFITAMNSWLAGPSDLSQRVITVRSIALLRSPNLAIVPPDLTQPGVWLDVFSDTLVRNEPSNTPGVLYRRHDFMLLARNAASQPEVREWRTIALVDSKTGGKHPQQIVGIGRFEYTFFDSPPPELKAATQNFVREVDRAVEGK